MTSRNEEQAEQRRWKLRPQWFHSRVFDELLDAEFLHPERQQKRQMARLHRMLRFAANHVPYYRELFRKLGLDVEDVRATADLAALPPLTKEQVREHAGALRGERLPTGEAVGGMTQTSGTTGQPVQVLRTRHSMEMFALLKQRELRWFRFDPSGLLAQLRHAKDLPPQEDGSLCEGDVTSQREWWPLVGTYFETGPFVGYDQTNPIEKHLDWLRQHEPDYLLGESGLIEYVALASQGGPGPERLRGVQCIAADLTSGMKRHIEANLKAPTYLNYGLNEFGIVASQCCEGGRYHVHTEHCLVEVVDDDNRPCPAGATGRVLVTSLNNFAMPLIRYDADDLAEAFDGPCPCGRTLPSFGAVTGRYRRNAYLPPGVWGWWQGLRGTMDRLPADFAPLLRRYQLHHNRDGRFELRLELHQPCPAELEPYIRQAWDKLVGDSEAPLDIVVMDEIPREGGSKLQSFTSDYSPLREA